MAEVKTYASESQHWYKKTGEPCYTVIGKNGKERNATLRDAKILNLVPGATTIINCANKPQLTAWLIDQHILACLTTDRKQGESEQQYIARIKEDARAQGEKAKERGKQVHAWVEKGFLGEKLSEEGQKFFNAAKETLEKECGSQKWNAEKSFATDKYGGKIDLESDKIIIDIKTTDKDLEKVTLWDDFAMQLAAYRRNQRKTCGILFINSISASTKLLWAEETELVRGMKKFESLLAYWRADKNLD